MYKTLTKTFAAVLLLSLSTISNAAVITGSVPSDYGVPTFGGGGIPNDQISYMTFNNGAYLLGLAITPRFTSPSVTNSGSSYFADTGTSTSSSGLVGSQWNFSFFAAVNNTSGFKNFSDAGLSSLSLFYDMDAGAGTDFGIWNFSSLLTQPITVIESSQNLLFSFLSSDSTDPTSGVSITAPAGGSAFDPFASGNYEFRWFANGDETVSIDATVGVPEPSTLAILMLSVFGLFGARVLRK